MERDKYIVIAEHYDKQLVKAVNDKIKAGYEPYGDVIVSFNETGVIKSYLQAMMLKEDK
ncbi:DUF1737 domain-containing protein [Candidatus Parabeggiatoa sp. HSG14]|uniref:DUF1737 domain-containing protein n=1 Tax=Candidatus Parabeggiatoa sp. HSG14 TaxID=3055593 RepID=UPI0025A727EA|nr:DUF1737 domain-containing protein [Thiotrichales bacterium HSG14]